MKQLFLLVFLTSAMLTSHAQVTIIYDTRHLDIVNENGAVRQASEAAHNNMLERIGDLTSDINTSLSSVVLVQRMIHRGLTEVDEALKTGRSALHVARLVQEIAGYTGEMLEVAREEPWLLLFAEDVARELKGRTVRLAADVSGFVLKEGGNVLMDYEKRDALMRRIILELKVIRALVFSMQRSMYWARINGALRTANPYRDFINMDKRKAEEIIRDYEQLTD